MAEFSEEELSTLSSHYVLHYMDDVQRRAVLRRAADLGAGLKPGEAQDAMVRLEEAVRSSEHLHDSFLGFCLEILRYSKLDSAQRASFYLGCLRGATPSPSSPACRMRAKTIS